MPRIYQNERSQKSSRLYFLPAVLWIILVVILSLLPKSSIPQYRWWHFPNADKVIHVGVYSVMAGAILFGFYGIRKLRAKQYMETILFCLLLGLLMECIQQTRLIGRHFEILDIIANIIGALLGSVLFLKIHKYLTHGSRN